MHRATAPIAKVATIIDWVSQQAQQDLLRFIICGSEDVGKSALSERLLWESQSVFEDQLGALSTDSKRQGTKGLDTDFALLVDSSTAEREQGTTNDVTYHFFARPRRKFIVAHISGHEQYIRNMLIGASKAELAVILVDARDGVLTQARRHVYLLSLMGIKQVVLAVNKMDLVDHKKDALIVWFIITALQP
jgi:bifunctional enzyme CysN/CysC